MYLGIDVGTQSVKALVYDPQARRIVDLASAPLALISRDDGTREQQAQWWLDALHNCIERLDATLRAKVQALAVSAQQHGFVPLDKTGTVLAPVKLWCDTATVAQCDEITAKMGGSGACIAETGNPVLAGYTVPKVLWFKQHHPDLYAKLATILLPHDYLNFYLTGQYAMECGDASGTGFLDVRNRCWSQAMLTAVDPERDLRQCLPPLLDAGAAIGPLLDEVSQALGLPAGLAVATGGGDNMMSAIGTGTVSGTRATISLGTSGTLFSYSDRPVIDDSGQVAAFCDSSGAWMPLVCTMNCTASTELTRALFAVDIAELDEQVQQAPAGADGVLTLPFFQGERTPNLPRANASLFGLTEANYTAANLLRSAMESAVYGLRYGLDAMRAMGCEIEALRLTGGGANSATWRQMVADVFQMRVSVQMLDEGAAFGAALQAMWTHRGGVQADLPALIDTHVVEDPPRCCEPNRELASLYQHSYEQYLRHVQVIGGLYQ